MKKELIEALVKVQRDLPVVKKGSEGSTGNRTYRYADLPTVWGEVEKVISDNGFFVTSESTMDGVKTMALHEHGILESFIPYTKEGPKPQELGSEITYFRRYNICAIFNIIVDNLLEFFSTSSLNFFN